MARKHQHRLTLSLHLLESEKRATESQRTALSQHFLLMLVMRQHGTLVSERAHTQPQTCVHKHRSQAFLCKGKPSKTEYKQVSAHAYRGRLIFSLLCLPSSSRPPCMFTEEKEGKAEDERPDPLVVMYSIYARLDAFPEVKR